MSPSLHTFKEVLFICGSNLFAEDKIIITHYHIIPDIFAQYRWHIFETEIYFFMLPLSWVVNRCCLSLCHCFCSNISLQWRHNEHDRVSNHQPRDCLFNSSFRRKSKKTSKLRVTGLCERNSPVIGEFPAQMVSNAENVSIWRRHHLKSRESIWS